MTATGATPTGARFPAYLVRGSDDVALSHEVRGLVGQLAAGEDPALVVEELGGDEYRVRDIVDAAQTPPFLTAHRVVLARGVGRFSTSEAAGLVAYLADPLDTTSLVLVSGGGQISRALVEAVRKVGHIVDADPPGGKGRSPWIADRLRHGPVRLDAAAAALVTAHLGEDVSRLDSLLDLLAAAFGPGARVGAADLEPFLGARGSVAPWELTDAIDRGDTPAAVDQARRQMAAGGRHPLVVMATLHNHFSRILRLEGDPEVADERSAAVALGMTGSTFPARKALTAARRLGHEGAARAITLLAEADLALRGTVEWPPEAVMEVLVARLSLLSRRSPTRR